MNICAICSNRQFASSDSLLQHARSSKKRHFFCESCKLVFTGEEALKTHKEAVHSSISCGICKLFFPNEEGLQVHYRDSATHTACRFCGAGFVDSNACAMHLRQHHGQTRKRRRRSCKSPTSSVDGGSSRSSSYSSLPPSSLRKSTTPESSVHTPVTVHTPLVDEPLEDDLWPDREEDDEPEHDALPIPLQYISPLRPTSPAEPEVAIPKPDTIIPSRPPTRPILQPEVRRRSSLSPEHSPLEPPPQTVFSPSWRPAGPSNITIPNTPSPIIVPPKPRLLPSLSRGSNNEVEYSPLEPQLSSHLTNASTPLLEAEMLLPPSAGDGDEDEDDEDWDNRPVIPPILADDKSEAVTPVSDDHCSETGHPSEYVNPYVDDADDTNLNTELEAAIPTDINTSVTTIVTTVATLPDSQQADSGPIISPVVAPSRQFSMTLPIIREASNIPLPSDTESEGGHEPMSALGDVERAFTDAPEYEQSPMPSLHSLPAVEDAFDGGDDFSDYAGSSVCPSPLDVTYLSRLAREICHTQSQGSMYYPDPFADYASSGAASPVEFAFDNHITPGPQTSILGVHNEGENHEVSIAQDDLLAETARVYDAFGHRDDENVVEGQGLESHELQVQVLERADHEHDNQLEEHVASDEVIAGHSSTWEDDAVRTNGLQTLHSPSIERLAERFPSPQRSRNGRSRIWHREDTTGLRVDRSREGYQSNADSTSGLTSHHSRSSSRSFNHSVDNETRMTSPVSPKEESPLLNELSLQNPRGPRFHCRLCMLDPCDEATATFCGHIFCHQCITEEIMARARCPVCSAPTLLYCLFRLDLHA